MQMIAMLVLLATQQAAVQDPDLPLPPAVRRPVAVAATAQTVPVPASASAPSWIAGSGGEPASALVPANPCAGDAATCARAAIERAAAAAVANDRPAFDAELAAASSLVARLGGSAPGDLSKRMVILDDVRRLWDAEFSTSFFAEDSDEAKLAAAYPWYRDAVRRDILVDRAGRRFFPAAESRRYLGRLAGGAGIPESASSAARLSEPAPLPAPRGRRHDDIARPVAMARRDPVSGPEATAAVPSSRPRMRKQ